MQMSLTASKRDIIKIVEAQPLLLLQQPQAQNSEVTHLFHQLTTWVRTEKQSYDPVIELQTVC